MTGPLTDRMRLGNDALSRQAKAGVRLAAGEYVIGGVRIVNAGDDAALGRELRTREVRVHSEKEAAGLRKLIAESDYLEMADA